MRPVKHRPTIVDPIGMFCTATCILEPVSIRAVSCMDAPSAGRGAQVDDHVALLEEVKLAVQLDQLEG